MDLFLAISCLPTEAMFLNKQLPVQDHHRRYIVKSKENKCLGIGKIKFRTRKAFLGRRRNKNLNTKGKKAAQEVNQTTEVGEGEVLGHRQENEEADRSPPEAPKKPSASATKLNFFGIDLNVDTPKPVQGTEKDSDCYIIVQKSCLRELFKQVICPQCFGNDVRLEIFDEKSLGFAASSKVVCQSCSHVLYDGHLCKRVGNSVSTRSPFEVNLLATVAFRGIGCGYSAINDWCGTMNIAHSLSKNGYQKAQKKLEGASKLAFKELSEESVQAIFRSYAEDGVQPDQDGILDIAVSFDGSWQKRGHSSHNGIAAVIELNTGLPIDYEVLSNFCIKCKIAENGEPSDEWKAKHAKNCPKNFHGTSNAMEVECARRLWGRSIEKASLRYTTMLCDGDSKSFDAVAEDNIYGKDKKLEKEDCINHISKRMGTGLRKLVDTAKAGGNPISGRGKLTKEKILKIQNYYGKAVKENAHDLVLLKKRIFAILFHLTSSDEMPKHMHCPPGPASWCFWQRDVANNRQPSTHREHETLPAEVGKQLVPLFRRLTDDGLLQRCVRGKTQNSNESFHNAVWKICPKSVFVGRHTIETAVAMAACQFSMGATFKTLLCKFLGVQAGDYMQSAMRARSAKRIQLAEKASSQDVKRRRKQLKYKNVVKEMKQKQQEGNTYAAGDFS